MYTYAWPSTSAVSFTDALTTDTLHAEVAHATQLRASLEHMLRDASGARPDAIRITQAATEYLPVLLGLYNSVLIDAIVVKHEPTFTWRSALLTRSGKSAMPGLHAELCAVLMLLGMALSNEAVGAVETLGMYELDTSVDAATRRANDDRLKVAADLLCRASGLFSYVATELLPRLDVSARPPELSRDVAMALSRFSLAEAHRLALRKLQSPALALATDTLTPGPPLPSGHPSAALLAKLHLHTASLYEQAVSLIRTHEKHTPHAAEPDVDVPRAQRSMHKLKSTLQNIKIAPEARVGAALVKYAEHEVQWHRALAHKWLGIDAGEQAKSTGTGVAHLAAARDQLLQIVPKGLDGAEKARVSLWEQRRAAKFHGDLGLWWMGVEAASVARWLDVYKRLNDTVSFQRVPQLSELQYASEGRAAVVAKPYEPPAPAFGPRTLDQVLDPSLCVGVRERSEARREYAGAGAYY